MSWRAKLGIIYPADGALDHEYYRMAPDGVSVHFTRISVPQAEQTLAVLEAQTESRDIEKAAADLHVIQMDAIAYACTSGSFVHGVGGDIAVIKRMEAAAGAACTTTTTASVRALRALDAKRVAIITPYPDEINERLQAFFEGGGIQVASLKGLGLYTHIFDQPAGAAYRLARRADRGDADAVFISCTNFRTLDVLRDLEQDLGKPVVSANQATMWDLLRLSGVRQPDDRWGSLFQVDAGKAMGDDSDV